MNRHVTLLVMMAVAAPLAQLPVWSSNPAAAARPRQRFTETVSYHSSGRLTYATGTKERDRTITMVPIDRDGLVASLDTTIVDHIDEEFEYHGVLNVDDTGAVTTRQKEMINAANILAVSPHVVKQLAEGTPEVVTQGHLEISGDIFDVTCTHHLIGAVTDVPMRVRTHTSSADGKIDLETRAAFGQDGMPLSAQSKGTIKAIVTVTVDLSLTRLVVDRKVAAGAPQVPAGGR